MNHFDPQLSEIEEVRQQALRKWLLMPEADDLRRHLEAIVIRLASQAMSNALMSDDEPNRTKLSESELTAAKRAKLLLDQWDQMRKPSYRFLTLNTK